MIIRLTAFTHKYPTIYKSDKMEWNTTDMVDQLNKAVQSNDKQLIQLAHNDLRKIIIDLAVECGWDLSMFNGNNDNPHNQTLIVGDGDPICKYLHAFVQQNVQVYQDVESKSLMNVNQLYGNVWEFTKSMEIENNNLYVYAKGGDWKIPRFLLNNNLKLLLPKDNRNYSIGFRLVKL